MGRPRYEEIPTEANGLRTRTLVALPRSESPYPLLWCFAYARAAEPDTQLGNLWEILSQTLTDKGVATALAVANPGPEAATETAIHSFLAATNHGLISRARIAVLLCAPDSDSDALAQALLDHRELRRVLILDRGPAFRLESFRDTSVHEFSIRPKTPPVLGLPGASDAATRSVPLGCEVIPDLTTTFERLTDRLAGRRVPHLGLALRIADLTLESMVPVWQAATLRTGVAIGPAAS